MGAVARFAITGLAALALLTFVGIRILSDLGTSEAERDARSLTRLAGHAIAAPYLTPALLAGRPPAVARLDQVVRQRLLNGAFVRVKVWRADGRIVYSDQHGLIGARYPLGTEELEALKGGGVDAAVSDLARPENRFERGYTKLLEVYLGLRATDGTPVLFEGYIRFSSIAASGQRLWMTFSVPMIGIMVLLELAQIPLALSLARQLRSRQRERETLLRRAIDASETERRRIASDLHDGPVQELAGVSYSLTAASGEMQAQGHADVAVMLDDSARLTRHSVRALRTLLVDIFPPRLHSEGLVAALTDLVASASASGLEVELDADPHLRLPQQAETILFRAAQESVRNVIQHAHARHLTVRLITEPDTVVLEIEDDGRGFALQTNGSQRHFGLRMLEELAHDSGGQLAVTSSPNGGTRVRLELSLP